MQAPPNSSPDPGALAMQSAGELSELSTIATAQLLGGISGMLVSEGLSKVLREIMGAGGGRSAPASQPTEPDDPAEAETAPLKGGSDSEALTGLSAKAMKELVAQGVAGRIVALNTLNTYLSLATAEQLRRLGAQLTAPAPAAPAAAPQAQPAAPAPAAAVHLPAAPGPYWLSPYPAWAGTLPSLGGWYAPPPYSYRHPGHR